MDVWSAGVCLFELATGHRPFTGADQQGMLARFWDNGIVFDPEFLDQCRHARDFFVWRSPEGTPEGNGAISLESPPKSGRLALKRLLVAQIDQKEDGRRVADFHDLVSQLLVADPRKRLTPAAALDHPFFT